MSEVRVTAWGGSTIYAVDDVDERGEVREATFYDLGEARRFAAERVQAERAVDQRQSRALLNRINGRGGPKALPRTLQGVLSRLAGVMQTRGR